MMNRDELCWMKVEGERRQWIKYNSGEATHTHTSEAVKFHGVDLPNYLFRKPTINMPPKSKRPQLLKRTSDGPPPQYYWRTHGKPQELQRRVMHGLLIGWSTGTIARQTGE